MALNYRPCPHGKQRAFCKECKGSAICPHGKQRAFCRDCKGSAICEHNKQRASCKECKGSAIREHNKQRATCTDCTDFRCLISDCLYKGRKFAGTHSLLRHTRRHHSDNPQALTTLKELDVHQLFRSQGLAFDY